MIVVKICVGSSCHIKGSAEIVEIFQNMISLYNIEEEIKLVGSFCTGSCNREGVTIVVDEVIHTGITANNFNEFFKKNILSKIKKEG